MKNKEYLLPEVVSIDDFPMLESLATLKSGIYKITFPEGVNGSLMKHASGDLADQNTTSIVAGGKIVGNAGLEELELSAEVSGLLMKQTNYSVLAARINTLSHKFNAYLNFQEDQYQSKISNMVATFKDISRKMPAILNKDNYSQFVSHLFPILKKDAGEFFELQKKLS